MILVRISAAYGAYLEEMTIPPELARPLRRADDFIRAGVIAAANVLSSAERHEKGESDFGLLLSTAYGTMQTNFAVLDQIIDGEQTSPTLFSHSVFNAAAGYIASIFDVRGCALTITDFTATFVRGLQEGCLALQSGLLSKCLVLQVETYSDLLHDMRRRNPATDGSRPWQSGAVCWLLERVERRDDTGIFLEGVQLEDLDYPPLAALDDVGEIVIGESRMDAKEPLTLGMSLTRRVRMAPMPTQGLSVEATGCWGKAGLLLK